MAYHPLNLALRFVLELAMLAALARWGYRQSGGAWIAAAALVFVAASVWGIFNVPGDPSRSGSAPVVVSGSVRLALELALFALASWALIGSGAERAGVALIVITLLHYAVSWERIIWLLQR